ncbi:Flp family type IVb pilin [Altererythrobacter salegens]|uniref:Flp family type IVb pilin n=1 Tax=Croceibacterium salegens TaxID=1737568 RepID=A0A6I4SY70_9SPHN|nr:Flp family type IVb pilin [Croceibacterium salegens]MXO60070.1 Flp family type IVb pilin [Croceibacterium salegens]
MKTLKFLRDFARDERGATAIEYGLILAMVFLAMVGAASALGDEQTSIFSRMSTTSVSAMQGSV